MEWETVALPGGSSLSAAQLAALVAERFVLIALVSFLLSTGYRLAARLLALARSKGLHTPTT